MILTGQEIEVQKEIEAVVDELERLRDRLRGLQAGLPEEDEVRACLGCVLADAIEPAIRDLCAAAGEGRPN